MTTTFLCVFSFVAGFVDAIVGGGGLVQLPALMILLPGVSIPTLFGTNKLVSSTGTAVAALQYSRQVHIDWHLVGPATLTAFIFSFWGSKTVALMNPAFLRPVILILLVLVAIYVFVIKELGLIHQPKHLRHHEGYSNFLEEGVAVAFSVEMSRTMTNRPMQPTNWPAYMEAWRLVQMAFDDVFVAAKLIREHCGSLGKATIEDLMRLFPERDPEVMYKLAERCVPR